MTSQCEVPSINPTDKEIKDILTKSKVIAIVGLSDKAERDSHKVAAYLKNNRFKIIPVNPNVKEVLSEKSYSSLEDIPIKIDIVDIFRKVEEIPKIVESAIKIGAKIIWMQEGLVHNTSANVAKTKGLKVIMNKCIMKEHTRLMNSP